ncbi:hypothetical protein EW636_09405 [Clostridium tetani]|nr:hypothetical protein EW636_09405 [Clostridium tetani]
MENLYYCSDCKRVFYNGEKCEYCGSQGKKDLKYGVPVNVIGSKLKGKIIKTKENYIRLLIRDDENNKYIREYPAEELRKVL